MVTPAALTDRVQDRTHVVLRPLGSGLPLGFFSFGVGMAMLAGSGLGWVPQSASGQLGLVLVTFVAPAELVAAVIAFLARDGLGATGLGLFAASWLTVWVQLQRSGSGVDEVVVVFLLAFSTAVVLLGAAALLGQPLIAALLLTAAARGYVDAVGEMTGAAVLDTIAGALALLVTAVAFYGGLALVLEDTQHRTVLPLGRRAQARTALAGSFDDQLDGLESEAGVRRAL